MKKLLTFSAFAAVVLAGCYNDKYDKLYPTPTTTTCDTSAVSYARDIQPIFNNNLCTSCHVSGGSAVTSGDFSSYNATWWGVARNRTNMLRDINAAVGDPNHMPQGSPTSLSVCDISKITAWIDQGYQNN